MNDCLFCKIVNKEIPASIVFEDDKVLAFLDINPVSIGHTLVVPKEHSESIEDISTSALCDTMSALPTIAKGVVSGVGVKAYNLGSNVGKEAGQAIMHTHFHIIPREDGDGLKLWPQRQYTDQSEQEETANKIRQAIPIDKT
jgi:histidine triad (HIT) family protein